MDGKDNQNGSAPIITQMVCKDKLIRNVTEIQDRFGNVWVLGNAGDYWHPPYDIGPDGDYRKLVRSIRNVEIRPDDILISSYPRTGLHWTKEIVNMLLNKTSAYCKDYTLTNHFLDWQPLAAEALPSPRILMTHVPFRYIPRQAFQKKIKIIFLERNPKDTLVSLFNMGKSLAPPMNYKGTFQQYLSFALEFGFAYGDLFDYLMERQEGIEAHPDVEVFTLVYEDTKKDPVRTVKELNSYLGTGCSDELCEDIASACSFKGMKAFKDQNVHDPERQIFKDGQLHIYRKGEVGDWKNWFTVAMNEEFDAEYNKRMSNYKRTYTYTL